MRRPKMERSLKQEKHIKIQVIMAIICWFMFRFENRNDIVLDVVEAISIHPNAMFYHKNWKLIAIL